jgi:hydroxyacylglutathione hydrolase
MLFQRVVSEGLAHYSYLIGDRDRAVVIDPRRDCDVYVEAAAAEGLAITHILETHRNEDYVIGSVELANRTGASIYHSAHGDLPYEYGEPIHDGEEIPVGRLRVVAMHTPGHTPGHMSYVLHDAGGAPWVVFTGDTLFAGEVGRTDFLGQDNLHKMTGLLYDSLFDRILPLGDGVIVCPAHGAGSVCGSGIADRFWTTVGLERKLNPRLQVTDKESFIKNTGRMLSRAPYFRTMERLNVEGAPLLGTLPSPRPLSASEFAERATDAWVVDTRMPLSYTAAHVPGAVALWEKELPTYAGWFLDYSKPVLLVGDTTDYSSVVRYLVRLGFDQIGGFLADGMLAWHRAGLESQSVDTVTVQQLCRRLDADLDMWLLDVRSAEEVAATEIPGACHIHIKEFPGRMGEVPTDRPVYIFCGSGVRSVVVASLLERGGWSNITVVLGGLSGWTSMSCPLPLE